MNPQPNPYSSTASASLWTGVAAIIAPQQVVNLVSHEFDQSVELHFHRETPTSWLPGEAQLQAIAALGFATVYCNFADDTEFIGGWRSRSADGKRQPGPGTWVMSPRREKVGTPRYQGASDERRLVLTGSEVELFNEFLAWKAARGI